MIVVANIIATIAKTNMNKILFFILSPYNSLNENSSPQLQLIVPVVPIEVGTKM